MYININLIETLFNATWLILLVSCKAIFSQYFYLQKQQDFVSNKNKKHTVKTNTYQSQSLLSSFTLFNNCLFICWHFDINFDLLFNMFTSSRFLIIKTFSLRHKLQLLINVLPLTCLANENLIVGTAPLSTISH